MSLLPENAPLSAEARVHLDALLHGLSPEQRAWLGGYLSAAAAGDAITGATPTPSKKALTILFGTESGNCEALAAEIGHKAKKLGLAPKILDMADTSPAKLKDVKDLLVVISTWGEGDPPERAEPFYTALMAEDAPKLEGLRYAVLGLGDTSYEHFCQMGKVFDARLEALGASRLQDRIDCDVDFEAPAEAWYQKLLDKLTADTGPKTTGIGLTPTKAISAYSKTNPFLAELSERVILNGTGSSKETLHIELNLADSGLTYLPGDTLGVKPANCPVLVDELLETLKFAPEEQVNRENGSAGPLRQVLIEELDSSSLTRDIIKKYAEFSESDKLKQLAGNSKAVKEYLWGRQIIDLVEDYPAPAMSPQDLADMLRKQPPRLYSIASAMSAVGEEVHLTVATVRYHAHGRDRKGIASTYLADRVAVGENIPVYVQVNKHFRLPENNDTPIIMVGPGTGIAPFRSFLQERAETNASGENWLFFGDQHFTTDFLYQLEFQQFRKDGVLTRIDTAFSRDQPEKVYVQHKMLAAANELWKWLERGAYFYVCGDASRMAKDVDAALIQVAATAGGLNEKDAKAYVKNLTKEKRYLKDVY